MLGNKFAKFVDEDLEDKIDAGPPAAQRLPAGAQQAPLLPAAAAAAAAANPPPFGQLEHAANPVPGVFNDKEGAAHAPQMQNGQRPNSQTQKAGQGFSQNSWSTYKRSAKILKKIRGFQMRHLLKELVGVFLFHVFTRK
jgi:hypothetical protein